MKILGHFFILAKYKEKVANIITTYAADPNTNHHFQTLLEACNILFLVKHITKNVRVYCFYS